MFHLLQFCLLCFKYLGHLPAAKNSLIPFSTSLFTPEMSPNIAAWLPAPKAKLEVKSAPYPSVGKNDIVVKNGAVAINPVDWVLQDLGNRVFSWLRFPFVLGTDAAGEIVGVGNAVTRFKLGDRVVYHAAGNSKDINNSARSAFQTYTVSETRFASPIPTTLSYESACVIPLGLSTAACGMFQKDQLALQLPSAAGRRNMTGKTLLIWGGSTSVGCNAIQLAVAAGYEVFTTCSPKNFDFVKKLGASRAFDYNSKTVVQDLIRAFSSKTTAGALSMGPGSARACMDVLDKCKGDKFLSMASYPVPQPPPEEFTTIKIIYSFLSFTIWCWFASKARHIRTAYIFGDTLFGNEVGKAIYEDFLPAALASGSYVAAPDPYVVGRGLEHLQTALDFQKKGVSATKVVVSL